MEEEDENNNSSEQEEDTYLVSCRCESAKSISALLSCLKRIASDTVGGSSTFTTNNINNNSSHEQQQYNNNNNRNRRSILSSSTTTTSTAALPSSVAASLHPVTVFCSAAGLTFHVYGTKSKQMQASVDMPRALFSDYSVASSSSNTDRDTNSNSRWNGSGSGGEFTVNLGTVLDCLHALGTHRLDATQVCFSYNATRELFHLELLLDQGVLCTAAIPGLLLEADDDASNHNASLAGAFRSSPTVARMIVRSEALQELVAELELVAGGTRATVALEESTGLQMTVVGFLGECHISLPAQGRHMVAVEFSNHSNTNTTNESTSRNNNTSNYATSAAGGRQPPPPQQQRIYPLHSLLESMRGLEIAQETCVTMNAAGMMAIQHRVLDPSSNKSSRRRSDSSSNDTATACFVDFIMCCMVPDDDDDEGETAELRAHNQAHHQLSSSPTTTGSPASTGAWSPTQDSCLLPPTQLRRTTSLNETTKISTTVVSHQKLFRDPEDNTETSVAGTENASNNTSASEAAAALSSLGKRRKPLSRSKRRRRPHRVATSSSSVTPRNGEEEDDDEDAWNAGEQQQQPRSRPSSHQGRSNRHDDGSCSSPELVFGPQ